MRQETALRLVEPGFALLDVGCGRGAVAAALAPRFREVQAVDGDPEALEVARARGIETRLLDLDARALPFEDARFDAVLCLEVIEHLRDPEGLVRELARVMREGGQLYLSTPNIRFAGYVRELVVGGRFPLTSLDPGGWQGGHVSFFTFADVERLLGGAGFDEFRHRGIGTAGGSVGRLAGRALGQRLSREFLSVGIFTVARRGPRRPPARAVARKEPRAY
jgi:methionine biosynthesis protein MetW